jgi:hypothetical protein
LIVTVIASVALITVALTVSLCAGLLRSQQRAAARREDLLLNQLLHLAGRPWQPSPADTWQPPAVPDQPERDWSSWPGAAEQEPVY